MIAQAATVFLVELRQSLKGRARHLIRRHGDARNNTSVAACRRDDVVIAQRPDGRVAHAGTVGRIQLAVFDFLHPRKALHHDFHVGSHYRVAKAAKLLLILLADGLVEQLFGNVVVLEEGRDAEKRAQKRIALHPELEVGAVGGFARDFEAGQDVNPQVVFLHEFPMVRRDALPGGFRRVARFPNQAAALLQPFERVGVRKGLRVAAKDDIDVIQFAVHADPLWGHRQVIIGRRAFLFGAVFGVGHDEEFFLQPPLFIILGLLMGNQVAKFADNRAKVLASGDHPPPADGMEADRDRLVRQQRRCVFRNHRIRVIDTKDEEGHAVRRALAVFAAGLTGGKLVSAQRVLRPKVARPDAVSASEQTGRLLCRQSRQAAAEFMGLQRLAQRDANVTRERIVPRQALVGALDDDDVLFALQRPDDCSLGEGPHDVDVNGPDLGIALFAQVIAGLLDVLSRAAQRNENRVGVLGFVFGDQPVVTPGHFAKLIVTLFEKLQNRLIEVVAPGDHAVHVMLLILDRAEQDGILEVHHFRHPAALGPEQFALGGCRTID